MQITIHLTPFIFESEAFVQARHGDRLLFTTPSHVGMADISELGRREYAQAVEISMADRTLRFGRDYLGHFPLLYACTKEHLLISDEYTTLRDALQKMGQVFSLSEEALALYP